MDELSWDGAKLQFSAVWKGETLFERYIPMKSIQE